MRASIMFLVMTVACGDNGDGRPEVATSVGTLCRTLAEVACHDMYNCCAEIEVEQYLGVREPRPESACVDDVETWCDRQLGEEQYAVAAGTLAYDADAMDVCLSALLAPADTCTFVGEEEPWRLACKDIARVA